MKKLFMGISVVSILLSLMNQAYAADPILIQREDFDAPVLASTDWKVSYSSGAAVRVDSTTSQLILETTPNIGVGTASVQGTRAFSVLNGTLIFKGRITDSYVDQGIYGDAQPRGLVAGNNRSNAIEFITTYPVPNTVACRTVANGVVTQTVVNIGQSVRSPNVYEIIAGFDRVRFFINGKLVATHISNIPTVPLNVYFSTGDSGFGNVPVAIDYVSYERVL